jgi:hypothetical protein
MSEEKEFINPIDFETAITENGMLDACIFKFTELFPDDNGDILFGMIMEIFEAGRECGYKAGRYFEKFERESEEIIRKHVNFLQKGIDSEKVMIKKGVSKPTVLVEG